MDKTDNILRNEISNLARELVDRPFGEHFENGYCESEMWAADLRDILKKSGDEAVLVEAISDFIVARERYGSDMIASKVRDALRTAGCEQPERPEREPDMHWQAPRKSLLSRILKR